MADIYQLKYTGSEIEQRLDKVTELTQEVDGLEETVQTIVENYLDVKLAQEMKW